MYRIFVYIVCLLLTINLAYASEIKVSNFIPATQFFVGRTDILKNINKHYNTGKAFISLVGVSGIGKSQIVRKYIENNSKAYKIIWIFDCKHDLDIQYQNLAHLINLNICNSGQKNCLINENLNIVTNEVIRFLQTENNWLLVYDNLSIGRNNVLGQILKIELNALNKQHILTTAQDNQGLTNIINVNNFSRKESLELLNLILDEHTGQRLDLNEISDSLYDYPLALVTVGNFLKQNQFLDMADYKLLLTRKTRDLKQYNMENFSKTVIKKLSANAKIMLYYMLILDNNLSKNLLYRLCQIDQSNCNRQEFLESLVELSKYSIIEGYAMKPQASKEDVVFEMHGFLQQSFRETSKDEMSKTLERMVSKINEWLFSIFRKAEMNVISQYPSLLRNLETMEELINEHGISDKEWLYFKVNLLIFYQFELNYNKSNKIIAEIDEWKLNNKFQVEKHREICANYYLYKGEYYEFALHDSKTATNNMEKALAILEGEEHNYPDLVFTLYTELAQIKIYSGCLKESQKYIKLAEDIMLKYQNKIIMFYFFYFTKAKIELESNLLVEALSNIDLCIQHTAKIPQPYFTASFNALKAEILSKLNKKEEASESIKNAYNAVNNDEFSNHELKARVLNTLAAINLKFGKTQDASEYLAKSISILSKDKTDAYLAAAYVVDGDIAFNAGDYSKAKDSYLQALEIYKERYKLMEVNHISELYYKIAITAIKLNDDFTFQKYFHIHEEDFGVEHMRTKEFYRALEVEKNIN